jgi:FixJ family two-component response regulator
MRATDWQMPAIPRGATRLITAPAPVSFIMPADRKLIAVIDDDVFILKALERNVRAAGYRCQTFTCAEDFLRMVRELFVACVISDINLGGMSGLQLAVHPVMLELAIPIVLITGSIEPHIEEPARTVAAALLHKPIPPGKLLDAIVDTVGPPIADGDF